MALGFEFCETLAALSHKLENKIAYIMAMKQGLADMLDEMSTCQKIMEKETDLTAIRVQCSTLWHALDIAKRLNGNIGSAAGSMTTIAIAWDPHDENDTRLATQDKISKLRRKGYIIEEYDDIHQAMRRWTYGDILDEADARRKHAACALALLSGIYYACHSGPATIEAHS